MWPCSARNGSKLFGPKVRSSQFHRDLEIHQWACLNDRNTSIQLFSDCKKLVVDAAAAAVVYDNILFHFAYHRAGLMDLVNSSIKIGQSNPVASSSDMSSPLSARPIVQKGVTPSL